MLLSTGECIPEARVIEGKRGSNYVNMCNVASSRRYMHRIDQNRNENTALVVGIC